MPSVNSPHVVNISDLRRVAKKRLPAVVFDYLDGGAEGEVTLRENCRVFDDVSFRPRHAVAFPSCDLHTTVLGHQISLPAWLAPVGYSRLMHPGGEVAAAGAAGKAGTGYTLSTISGHKLENVRAATTGPVWYQLYLMGGRAAAEGSIDRARRAGFTGLVITIDTPVSGIRERDPRNGMVQLLNPGLLQKIPYAQQFITHPGWLMDFLRDGGVPPLQNVVLPGKGPMPLTDIAKALADSTVTWNDLKWIRELWSGPIIVKVCSLATTAGAPWTKAQPPSWFPITAAASSIAFPPRSARASRSRRRRQWSHRSVDGRRRPPRHRYRESHLSGSARSSMWPRLRLRSRRRRRTRRGTRPRNSA